MCYVCLNAESRKIADEKFDDMWEHKEQSKFEIIKLRLMGLFKKEDWGFAT